ncbi:MAG: hypothetical protein KC636_34975, partial [Myxococcales bacterium]|nr:hypothetical protein [Myxococcales bacterium]
EIYEKWRPTNFEVDVYRGDIRVREALTHSVNTVAIKLADAVGLPAVHAFARAAGIESPLADNLSLALGVSEVRPIELLGGYLTLARGGSRVPVTLIKKIEAPGEVTWEPGTKPERALRQEVVFILTSMMTSVVAEGTGTKAQALGRPVAAKTGTSSDLRDAWFAGFTPAHVAVAWVGFDVPKRLGKSETGGRAALPIWLELMKAAEADTPPGSFVPPPSVLVRTIDRKTGLLAPPMIEQADGTQLPPPPESLLEEYFISGTEPVERAEPAALPAGDALLDLYGTGETGDDPSGGEAPTGEDPGTEPTEPVADSAGLPSLLDE